MRLRGSRPEVSSSCPVRASQRRIAITMDLPVCGLRCQAQRASVTRARRALTSPAPHISLGPRLPTSARREGSARLSSKHHICRSASSPQGPTAEAPVKRDGDSKHVEGASTDLGVLWQRMVQVRSPQVFLAILCCEPRKILARSWLVNTYKDANAHAQAARTAHGPAGSLHTGQTACYALQPCECTHQEPTLCVCVRACVFLCVVGYALLDRPCSRLVCTMEAGRGGGADTGHYRGQVCDTHTHTHKHTHRAIQKPCSSLFAM